MIKSVNTLVTTKSFPWLPALEPCTKTKVCTPITSYTFLVTEPAQLHWATSPLWQFGEVCT